MKSLTRHFFLIAILVSTTTAAKVEKEKIETKILELPKVSLETVNYQGITVEYALGDVVLGKTSKLSHETLCTPKGKFDPTKVNEEYYAVEYTRPPVIMVAKDGSGKVVFAERISDAAVATELYGKDECRFWFPGIIEGAWEKEKENFRKELQAKELAKMEKSVTAIIQNALFARYAPEEFGLYTVEDKNGSYKDLDEAFKIAEKVYLSYNQTGYSSDKVTELKKAVAIWEKALEESNLSDRKARINHKITLKLHENLGVASMYVNDYESALLHFNKIKALEKSSTNTSIRSHFSQIRFRALNRITGVNRNRDVLTSDAKISKALSEADNYRSQVKITDRQDRYDALVLEFKKYSAATGKENQEYASQANSKAVASGKANPYDGDVMYTATQGYAFMKTPIMAMGQTYTEVPAELCAIERLNQLIITNNKVALVPSEIGQLKNLKLLNLKKNKISELPEELGQLTKVEKMDFSNNNLSKLPDSIAKLTSLEKLNLKGNPLSGDEIARIKAALPNCKIKF